MLTGLIQITRAYYTNAKGVGALPHLSRIQTAIVAAITSNVQFADASENVLLAARSVGLVL